MSKLNLVRVIEDPDCPGEFLLDLGPELCEQVGWQVGDTIEWVDNNNGTWTMRKAKNASSV